MGTTENSRARCWMGGPYFGCTVMLYTAENGRQHTTSDSSDPTTTQPRHAHVLDKVAPHAVVGDDSVAVPGARGARRTIQANSRVKGAGRVQNVLVRRARGAAGRPLGRRSSGVGPLRPRWTALQQVLGQAVECDAREQQRRSRRDVMDAQRRRNSHVFSMHDRRGEAVGDKRSLILHRHVPHRHAVEGIGQPRRRSGRAVPLQEAVLYRQSRGHLAVGGGGKRTALGRRVFHPHHVVEAGRVVDRAAATSCTQDTQQCELVDILRTGGCDRI